MKWIRAHSTNARYEAAWNEVRAAIRASLSTEVHFLLLFVAGHASSPWASIAQEARAAFPGVRLAGGASCGAIVSSKALEEQPSVVAIAASLDMPNAIEVVHVPAEKEASRRCLHAVRWHDVHGALVLYDPRSTDGQDLAQALLEQRPNLPVAGGAVCREDETTDAALWSSVGLHREGALLILLRGNLRLRSVSAQGVVPMGDPCIIMKKRGNLIDSLDAGVPVEVVGELFERAHDLETLQWEQLVLGVDPSTDDLSMARPHYVMRGIVGADPRSGAVAVDAKVRTYQTVQFHMRNAQVARQELRVMLAAARERSVGRSLQAAIVFNSEARDRDFYHTSSVDAREIAAACAPAPTVGMFSKEEIGPVGRGVGLHQFSSTIALIYQAS